MEQGEAAPSETHLPDLTGAGSATAKNKKDKTPAAVEADKSGLPNLDSSVRGGTVDSTSETLPATTTDEKSNVNPKKEKKKMSSKQVKGESSSATKSEAKTDFGNARSSKDGGGGDPETTAISTSKSGEKTSKRPSATDSTAMAPSGMKDKPTVDTDNDEGVKGTPEPAKKGKLSEKDKAKDNDTSTDTGNGTSTSPPTDSTKDKPTDTAEKSKETDVVQETIAKKTNVDEEDKAKGQDKGAMPTKAKQRSSTSPSRDFNRDHPSKLHMDEKESSARVDDDKPTKKYAGGEKKTPSTSKPAKAMEEKGK